MGTNISISQKPYFCNTPGELICAVCAVANVFFSLLNFSCFFPSKSLLQASLSVGFVVGYFACRRLSILVAIDAEIDDRIARIKADLHPSPVADKQAIAIGKLLKLIMDYKDHIEAKKLVAALDRLQNPKDNTFDAGCIEDKDLKEQVLSIIDHSE